MSITNMGQDIELTGKSGQLYRGRILDKSSTLTSRFPAIVCLTNSHYSNGEWHHDMKNVYGTDDALEVLEHFRDRGDISHLIVISRGQNERNRIDPYQDLIEQYVHGKKNIE